MLEMRTHVPPGRRLSLNAEYPSHLSLDKSDFFGKGLSSGEETFQIAQGKLKEAQLWPVCSVNQDFRSIAIFLSLVVICAPILFQQEGRELDALHQLHVRDRLAGCSHYRTVFAGQARRAAQAAALAARPGCRRTPIGQSRGVLPAEKIPALIVERCLIDIQLLY